MRDMYCKYQGKKYKAKKRNANVIITSKEKEPGFTNYIDVLGKEHKDFFMKMLRGEEVESLYKEDIFVVYEEREFELFAGEIFPNDVKNNEYMIWTSSEQVAKELAFEKKEQFVFVKEIKRDEIQAIKVIKKFVCDTQNRKTQEEVFEGADLDNWLERMK